MINLIKMIENLASQSVAESSKAYADLRQNRWKYCVALAELGWEAYDFEAVPSTTEEEVIIKWRKEGKKDICVKLGFTDQRLWIKYMQNAENKNETDKETSR